MQKQDKIDFSRTDKTSQTLSVLEDYVAQQQREHDSSHLNCPTNSSSEITEDDVEIEDADYKFELTNKSFKKAILDCYMIFRAKLEDYGPSWRIMRPVSVTDQIYIKANRIRNLETIPTHYVGEGILPEFQAIVNYCIVGLIQLKYGHSEVSKDISNEQACEWYEKFAQEAYDLMIKKNHDYNEAWKLMRVNSYTDFILMKLFRVMEIEEHDGVTRVSEPISSNYMDIMNYAVFGIIKLTQK